MKQLEFEVPLVESADNLGAFITVYVDIEFDVSGFWEIVRVFVDGNNEKIKLSPPRDQFIFAQAIDRIERTHGDDIGEMVNDELIESGLIRHKSDRDEHSTLNKAQQEIK